MVLGDRDARLVGVATGAAKNQLLTLDCQNYPQSLCSQCDLQQQFSGSVSALTFIPIIGLVHVSEYVIVLVDLVLMMCELLLESGELLAGEAGRLGLAP